MDLPPLCYPSLEELIKHHQVYANCTHLHAFGACDEVFDIWIHNDAFIDQIRGLLTPLWVNGYTVILNTDVELPAFRERRAIKLTRLPVFDEDATHE